MFMVMMRDPFKNWPSASLFGKFDSSFIPNKLRFKFSEGLASGQFLNGSREHNGIRQTFTANRDLEKKAAEMRLLTLRAISRGEVPCMGSAMSAVDVLVALYYGQLAGRDVMREEDVFVLGKGQAAPALYAILADLGFFDLSELDFLGKEGALLVMEQGAKVPGNVFSNFVTAQGLSVALGLALAAKMEKRTGRVYTLLSNGDFENGQTFEAMMMANEHRLDNLVCVVDDNRPGFDSGIYDKVSAFGFSVIRVFDGHNFEELLGAFTRSFTTVRRPVCIWCKTVLGKGVDFAEGKESYQRAIFSENELKAIEGKFKALIDG